MEHTKSRLYSVSAGILVLAFLDMTPKNWTHLLTSF